MYWTFFEIWDSYNGLKAGLIDKHLLPRQPLLSYHLDIIASLGNRRPQWTGRNKDAFYNALLLVIFPPPNFFPVKLTFPPNFPPLNRNTTSAW